MEMDTPARILSPVRFRTCSSEMPLQCKECRNGTRRTEALEVHPGAKGRKTAFTPVNRSDETRHSISGRASILL